jgi:azurin
MLAVLFSAVLAAAVALPHDVGAQEDATPHILLDQPLRAVEYQLDRLTNGQLVRLERKTDDVRYRPVYYALLTRSGLAENVRKEAVAALTKMDGSSETRVLLAALAKVRADDAQTADALLDMLLGQPVERLRRERETFSNAIAGQTSPAALRGAYGGMMLADGRPDAAWRAAVEHEGHLVELLRSVPHLGGADPLRDTLFAPIAALIEEPRDPAIRVQALAAVGWTRRDAATFELLARAITQGSDPESRAAAVRSLQVIPERVWTRDRVEPLARAIVAMVKDAPPERRTDPATTAAIELGERLAAALPGETRVAISRELRSLGVRVVRLRTVPEQMLFDQKWFVVEAGRAIQIAIENPDAMPHNLVIARPGALQEVGKAGGVMPPPADPGVKPYVPDTPLVLFATKLIGGGESARLNFTAPQQPGEYVYLCTFPGHWVRMYGVMLVVQDLDAWSANPVPPADPVTKERYERRQ